MSNNRFASIPDAAARKEAQIRAAKAMPTEAERVAQAKARLHAHYHRAIMTWASASGEGAISSKFEIREDQITEVAAEWQTELQKKGYNVTRKDGMFVISLQP